MNLGDSFPDLNGYSFFPRQEETAFFLAALNKYIEDVTNLDVVTRIQTEFRLGNVTFGLIANINKEIIIDTADDCTAGDITDGYDLVVFFHLKELGETQLFTAFLG